jgi:hypothetical protein
MILQSILLIFLVATAYAEGICNYHFSSPQTSQEFVVKGFGKTHSYEYPRIHEGWDFLEATPKAYVNQVQVKPIFSYLELKDSAGRKLEIDNLTGEEIIQRSGLPSSDPRHLDINNISGEGFYHGDDVEPHLIKQSGGFKQRADTEIIDRDLIHHAVGEMSISRYAEGTPLAGQRIRSGFMGSTITPLDMHNDGSWGKYIYDFRGVPGWDLKTAENMAKTELDNVVLRSVSGEREIVIPRDIPVWCLLRVATTSTSSVSGRTRISRWDINPEFNPELCRKYFAR